MSAPVSPPAGGAHAPRPPAGAGRDLSRRTGLVTRLRREDRGGATAEVALVLPAVAMLLVVLLLAGSAAVTQVRVADAARSGARAAALGESEQAVGTLVRELAGAGAAVRVGREGEYVVVEVSRTIPGPLGWADLRARADARSLPEPGAEP